MKSVDQNWLRQRKEILQKIKDQVRLYLGPEPMDIQQYALAYKNDLEKPWQPSTLEELQVQLHQVNIVYGGDFHPYAQAQRAHLRILRDMVGERKLILALEALPVEHQDKINAFLAGKLEEKDFLRAIQWKEYWGFPWKNYKPLLDFAIKNQVEVVALNKFCESRSGKSLNERDEVAAEVLADRLQKESEALFYVIYGDLHIAEKHLPARVKTLCDKGQPISDVILYQNSETIFWGLAEQGLEQDVEIVKFSEKRFCLLSSPPWVKWHSYLMYLEENFDIGLDEDEDEVEIDHTDHVSALVQMITSALATSLSVDDIEVYSLQDPQILKKCKKAISTDEYKHAVFLVNHDSSFYVPKQSFMYLSKSTVNHAATLAGKYVHAKLSRRQRMLWEFPEDFLATIWEEAMAFLLSKIINPKRKAQTMADLKKQLEAFDPQDKGREPLLLALDQKMSELLFIYKSDTRAQKYIPRERSSYIQAARFLGEMLGERCFHFYHKQTIDRGVLLKFLSQDLSDKGFADFYFEQLKLLDKLELEESSEKWGSGI